jgi:hypothetical protein
VSLKGTVWAPIGPSPINEGSGQDNGLVTTLAVNPNNPSVLYMGTAQGGVWRSGDGGNTWTPLFDKQLSLGIGEPAGIAVDPSDSDTVYVGTSGRVGSAEPDTLSQPAAGLFKSTDGGASWNSIGSFGNQWINVIIVDPASGVLYLASSKGVFTSQDAGITWTAATGISGDTRSLALDLSTPANARILHAGVAGSGVFRSKDSGRTFSQTLSATTAAVATALGGKSFTRVVVALAPPTSPADVNGVQVIYVTMAGGYGVTPDPVGVFLSTDQGATWTLQGGAGISGTTYGGYALDMAVDPASPGDGLTDIIYFGCQNQFKSTDAGATFNGFPAPGVGHADTHTWTLVPGTGGGSTTIYCGNDGGLDVSTDGGSTWKPLNKGGLQTGLFYNIAIKPDATASVTAGALQDNNVLTTALAPSPAWGSAIGGDGWDVAYDGGSPPTLYGANGGPATSISASTDDGVTFSSVTPPWTSVDTGGTANAFLLNPIAADPSNVGVIYASGALNLWQRFGGTWRIVAVPGNTGTINVAPANGNNVVLAAATQVFVSTNALAATVGPPTGVTFSNITRNLPARNVARAVFDPVDPTVIYAVLTGFTPAGQAVQNVFRTTIGGTAWTNISPALNLPCGAIAVDGTTTPTTLYVGTDFGVIRSVDTGATWSKLDDIHFPLVPVFALAFNPKAGVLRAATYGRGVFEFGLPAGAAIAVNLEDGLDFGTVCSGPAFLTLTVYNVGATDLIITSVARLSGSTEFSVLPNPATPLIVAPGEDIEFTVRYARTTPGAASALIRIISNDPAAPFVDLPVSGFGGTGKLATAIASGGSFGNVCVGSFRDELLTLNNVGPCPLSIFGIFGSGAFLGPSTLSYPLVIAAGASLDVIVRFAPSAFGTQVGTITITSDDLSSPHVVPVSGVAPPPKAKLIIADTGNFGRVCVGSHVDEPLLVNNSGLCDLTVTGVTSTSAAFIVPEAIVYPIVIAPGDSLSLPIRFAPAAFGAASATITVSSDDPAGPLGVAVSGEAPPGKLAITGSTLFGGVNAHCCADRTLSICNTGDCALHVTRVFFKRRSRHWKILHDPFPATLHPGSCLPIDIHYYATEKCPRSCELVIESDDPATPVRCVEVLAYTIWDSCGCNDCEDCRKGCCEKRHHEPCRQGYPCCDDDDCCDCRDHDHDHHRNHDHDHDHDHDRRKED